MGAACIANICFLRLSSLFYQKFAKMTQEAIQEQINAIKQATQNALQSKETAEKFLLDAGIIKIDEKAIKEPPKK